MNVLITTDAFPPGGGGSGRSTSALAAALSRRGHHVRVVVARQTLHGVSEWEGIPVSEVEIPAHRTGSRARERAYAEGLARALGEEAWDLVHAQHWLSALATRTSCPRLPMVVTIRDYWPVCIWSTRLSGTEACPGCSYRRRVICTGRQRPLLWPIAPVLPAYIGAELARRRFVLEQASAVIAVSRHVAETLPTAAEVIPNFVPPSAGFSRPADVPERYVLFVGKLEPNKAPDRLLPILEAAQCSLPLVIAGSGGLENELRRDAQRTGRDVRFLGWVEEERVRALMQHADAVLFPSRWQEPLSRVLIDGLGVGAALVVQPTGGSADIVVDGESGLVGDTTAELGAALTKLLSGDELSLRLRDGAKRRAETVFSENVVVPKAEALYRKVSPP